MEPPLTEDAALLSPQLPRMWIGYFFAALYFVTEIVEIARNPSLVNNPNKIIPSLLIIGLAGGFYWLYCVYKFHDVLTQVRVWDHPITVGRAVAFHFIPFYNLYWIFKWPKEIAGFVNWRTQASTMSPYAAGSLLLLAALIGRLFESAIALALIFSTGVYISRRLRTAFSSPPPADSPGPQTRYDSSLQLNLPK